MNVSLPFSDKYNPDFNFLEPPKKSIKYLMPDAKPRSNSPETIAKLSSPSVLSARRNRNWF